MPAAKKKAPTNKVQTLAIPATLPWNDPEENAAAEEAAKKEAEGKGNPDIEALKKQIASLTEGLTAARQTNMALMSQAPTVQKRPPAGIDTKGLPDPTLNPDQYAAEVSRRTAAYQKEVTEYERHQAGQQQTEAQRLNALWEEFGENYEAYAGDEEKVSFAAQKVARRAQSKGIDLNKYMYQNSDQFMRDVVSVYDKTFGKPKVESEVEEETDDDESENAVVFGGIQSGGKPNTKDAPEGHDDMFADLKEFQQKGGWHR